MKLAHGWAWPDADQFMVDELQADGYQRANLEAGLKHVTDWSCAIDGGAHVGTWTRILSGRFARVIAVEPSPDTADALRANIASFELRNVDVRAVALGRGPGFIHMELDALNAARKNTGGRYVAPGGTIPVQRIDDWHLPALGFLKLDIEGSEPDALVGAGDTILRCKPVILYEDKALWKRRGHRRDAVEAILARFAYREIDRCGSDAIWGPL